MVSCGDTSCVCWWGERVAGAFTRYLPSIHTPCVVCLLHIYVVYVVRTHTLCSVLYATLHTIRHTSLILCGLIGDFAATFRTHDDHFDFGTIAS